MFVDIAKRLKGALASMIKMHAVGPAAEADSPIIGKRRLDYSFPGFISSTIRPPLSSPKLEKNSGVNQDGKGKR